MEHRSYEFDHEEATSIHSRAVSQHTCLQPSLRISSTTIKLMITNKTTTCARVLPVPFSARPARSLCPASCLRLQPHRGTRPCGEDPCTRCVPLARGGRRRWGFCRRSPSVGWEPLPSCQLLWVSNLFVLCLGCWEFSLVCLVVGWVPGTCRNF